MKKYIRFLNDITDSGPEIAFNNFVKIPEVSYIILSFRMYYIQTFFIQKSVLPQIAMII